MTRAFLPHTVESETIDRLLDRARRAPSAGNTQAVGFVVLDSTETVSAYWATTLGDRADGFRWQGLLQAPALVIVTVTPDAYVERYAEPDKARTGLGQDTSAWQVPYWWVDAGAVAQNLLLLAVDRGWGACLFGLFEHEPAVVERFGLDPSNRLVATVALGHALPDEPSRSADRSRPALGDVITRPS